MRFLLFLLLAICGPAPAAPDGGCEPDAQAGAAALNALRAQARECGGHLWPAAPALHWQAVLGDSARRHAQELARRDHVEHVGEAGQSLRARLHEAGYVLRAAGENLAGGPQTLDEALAHWLASTSHCENLMTAEFQDFGLACVTGPGRWQRYWVLQMAAPAGRPEFRSSPGR
ncbi:CAP domain-containing protein [Roseateles saccharophilus]|uniref:Cysteine-rich secretory family protein n=1 Tax=Roseateles saccharophilus TaxID=304 RepID=A0A4R3VJK6_ROSSA|nr:CAP domain-containing protein [Roseateles saccharophilus]MDG0831213.1 CAP domain-containing protein [Roseateles saccharophilus]TCV04333.1 cysteine-rich secretory family protein [Roseateles saccharophilus]